jgi:hypothetical protein
MISIWRCHPERSEEPALSRMAKGSPTQTGVTRQPKPLPQKVLLEKIFRDRLGDLIERIAQAIEHSGIGHDCNPQNKSGEPAEINNRPDTETGMMHTNPRCAQMSAWSAIRGGPISGKYIHTQVGTQDQSALIPILLFFAPSVEP